MNPAKLAILAVLAFGLCGLGGCYNAKEVNSFLLKPRRPVSGLEYRVLPPDVILITSRYVPEVNGVSMQIRPDGKINLPLLGEIYVANLTSKQIEALINKTAGEYYDQVDSTVNVVGYNSQKYYVFGQVNRQGPVPWTGRDTLLDALAQAQPTNLAWPERIIVVRGDQPQEGGVGVASAKTAGNFHRTGVMPEDVENPRGRLTFNLMAMVEDGDMSRNIMLMPGDVIYVQPNPFAKIGLALQNFLFPLNAWVNTVQTPNIAWNAARMN